MNDLMFHGREHVHFQVTPPAGGIADGVTRGQPWFNT